jgi:nucleoside phosphorylase
VIAITFALPVESSAFIRRLRQRQGIGCSDTKIVHGTIDGRAVTVFHTGVGEKICRRRMAEFLQDRQPRLLISAGFAAALTDESEVGHILLARNFCTVKLDRARAALAELGPATADLATVSRILDSAADRTRTAQQTGAVAADMETDFIARVCAEHAVPLLSLRVISDTPARPLPAPADVLFDVAEQKTKLSRLGFEVAKHPTTLPRLLLFAQQASRARCALTSALAMLLQSDFVARFIS